MCKYMCKYQINIKDAKLSNLRVREVDTNVQFEIL